MNLDDEYQKFLIFITLLIAGDEGLNISHQAIMKNGPVMLKLSKELNVKRDIRDW